MAASMDDRNRRQYPREKRIAPARVVFAWGMVEGRVENIGEGGAFFVTDTLEGVVVEGDRTELYVEDIPDSAPVRLPGLVLRVERYFQEGEILRTFAIRFDAPYHPVPV